VFKFVGKVDNERARRLLQRLRLYHPPLQRLKELSQGTADSLTARSAEFSELLNDVLINGVWKRTGPGRLVSLDQWITAYLQRSSTNPFSMLDVGGSDGSTTFDTLACLRERFGVDARATILEMQLRLRCFRRGPLQYYLTHDGRPLLLQTGAFGILFEEFGAKGEMVFNPIVRLARRWLHNLAIERHMRNCGDLLLESPLAANNPRIDWIERDLFEFDQALTQSFDFVRCCNVLNLGYFAERRIKDGLQILSRYLKHDGLLLVARSVDGENGPLDCATLWRRTERGMAHVADLNGGSEVKHLMSARLTD
jgi:hypothetical protein